MYFPDSIDRLRQRLTLPLPGFEAHRQMFPRSNATSQLVNVPENARLSAVAILLFESGSSLQCIIIRRSEYDGTHSGQLAFPGGKFDDGDGDLMRTALRECYEEIGIEESELIPIGTLSDVYTVVSSFLITPYLFYWKAPHERFNPSPREVAAIHQLPLEVLVREESVQLIDVPLKNGVMLKSVPHFVVNDLRIWGATAVILSELKAVLLES